MQMAGDGALAFTRIAFLPTDRMRPSAPGLAVSKLNVPPARACLLKGNNDISTDIMIQGDGSWLMWSPSTARKS